MTKTGDMATKEGPMLAQRLFSVMWLLSRCPDGLTLSAISSETGAPKSSMSAILKSMCEQKYLVRENGIYAIGPEAYSLAMAIVSTRSLRRVARPYLLQAATESGETCLLAVMDQDAGHSSYIDSVESKELIRYSVPVGTSRPLFANAAGKLFLAYLPPSWREAYIRRTKLVRYTDCSIVDKTLLNKRCQQIRRDGISIEVGEFSPHAAGFAAPILGINGEIEAALIIAAPNVRAETATGLFSEIVVKYARLLSSAIGGQQADRAHRARPERRQPALHCQQPRRRSAKPLRAALLPTRRDGEPD